jgi:hypothetical protein
MMFGRRTIIVHLLAIALATVAVSDAHAERIRMFGEPGFGGWNKVLLNSQPNLGDGEGFHVASIRVMSGSWLLCTDTNFIGDCLWTSRDIHDLRTVGFDRPILSARPERIVVTRYHWGAQSRPHRSLVMFAGENYQGAWKSISADAPTLDAEFIRLRPNSVVVQVGVWRLCSDVNYGGRCLTVTGDVWNLHSIFQSPILSLRRIDRPEAQAAQK